MFNELLNLAVNEILLNESSVHKPIKNTIQKAINEGLTYHLDNDIPFDDSVYRPGTKEFFGVINEARKLYESGLYDASESEIDLFESEIGSYGDFDGESVPLDFPMWDEDINEAKYKGREVKLGAAGASRSGGKAHVYVRDPKSGKVKKVSFGSSLPDAMGDSQKHKARRKSFAARHRCSKNKDKMSAGYWACRATKMFGRNVPGWW